MISLLALIVRLPGLFWGFHYFIGKPFLFLHFDELAFGRQFCDFLTSGELARKDYVLGFPVEVRVLSSLFEASVISPFVVVMIARAMNIAFAVGTIPLVYAISTKLYRSSESALYAVLLLALAPLHIAYSHYATPLASATFWFYLSCLALIIYLQEKRSLAWMAACVATGAATAVKFFAMPVASLILCSLRGPRKFSLLMTAIFLCSLTFFLFNNGVSPSKLVDFRNILVADNFHERYHLLWANPMMYLFDLLPGLGAPFFLLVIAGVAIARRSKPDVSSSIWTSAQFISLELPVIIYTVVICLMTASFARHVVPLIPYLAIHAGRQVPILWEQVKARIPAKMLNILVSALFLYQLAAALTMEWNHLQNRPTQAAQWLKEHMREGERVYIPSHVVFSSIWEGLLPETILTGGEKYAEYVLVSEGMTSMVSRTQTNPLSDHPTADEIYHPWFINDVQEMRALIDGESGFEKIAEFRAATPLPEFSLYKWLFHSIIVEYGDVTIYKRKFR